MKKTVKKQKISKAKKKFKGRRKYHTTWHYPDGTEEKLTVYSIPNGANRELMQVHDITEKATTVAYYADKLDKLEKSKEVGEVDWYEHLLFKATADLDFSNGLLGEDICRLTVDKSVEWFNSLTPEEWGFLYAEVIGLLHHVPIKHTYMLVHQRSVSWFLNRGKQSFTGDEVSKALDELAVSFLSGEKKKTQ